MPTVRFTKSGPIERYREDWPDAKPFSEAPGYLRQAGADTTILIGFDRDHEDPIFWSETALRLTRSGKPGRPIRIEAGFVADQGGIQLAEVPSRSVFFRQSGSGWAGRTVPDRAGEPFLALYNNASNVRLAGYSLVGAPGSGFIRFRANDEKQTFSNVFIEGLSATRVGRVIDTDQETHLTSLIVQDCDAFEIVRGFARFHSISDLRFRNLFLDAAGVDAGGPRICQIIAINSGENLLFENITMKNAINALDTAARGSDYIQGDGIVCEKDTSDIMLRNCRAVSMGDGGFDLKTNGFVMENCSSHGCKYGLRVWARADNIVRHCAFEHPRGFGSAKGACIWAVGHVDIIDSQLQAGPGTSAFRFWKHADGGEPRIRIFGGAIRLDRDAELAKGDGTIELNDVTINGELQNGVHHSSEGWSFLKGLR